MKTILVTGASGGIGEACIRLLAEKGYTVLAVGNHHRERLMEVVSELERDGMDVHAYFADVSSSAQIDKMAKEILTVYHHVDGILHVAGVSYTGLLCDMTDEEWDHVLDTNLSSAFYLMRSFVPEMVRRASGSIVLVSSMWGRVGASCEAAYSASKAGLIGLARAMAKELGPSGIRVNCVAPGVIDTPMMDEYSEETKKQLAEETPLMRIGSPKEVANACVFLLSEEAGYVTGQVLGVDGGYL